MGISGVDDQIPLFEEGEKSLDHRVHRGAGRNQHHDRPRTLQASDKLLHRPKATDIMRLPFFFQGEDFLGIPVIARHREPVVGHIQQQVAAHHPKPHHSDFKPCLLFLTTHDRISFLIPINVAKGCWVLPKAPKVPHVAR